MRVKISVPTRTFSVNVRLGIRAAVEAGAQGVQFDLRSELPQHQFGESARRQLLHHLSENRLTLASVHFPLRSSLIHPINLQERVYALTESIQFASKLQARTMTLRIGALPDENDTRNLGTLRAVLNDLTAVATRVGVNLCIFTGAEPVQQTREFFTSVSSGKLMVNADVAAWVINQQSISSQISELHDIIGHFEVRDAITGVDGRGREVPTGQGEVDWNEFFALIAEMDYSGWLNVDRTEGSDRSGDIARSISFLNSLQPRPSASV
ncbi:sugar phosphate isomerase/epimerase family protein [Planctomicrobium sp. SH668]|uniref:sugar phosphate isomerase/epimerase family protein n=1 Tax=Planctomicrobium sp. SH668 TaxID=3448126 RepID=UPI003F5BF4E1